MEHSKYSIQLILSVPNEYQSIITTETRLQEQSGTSMTLDDLELALEGHWRRTYGTKSNDDRSSKLEKELTFLSMDRVQCYRCKKYGHYKRDCPDGKDNGQGSTNGNDGKIHCSICNKWHKGGEKGCFLNPNNKNVPKWFKRRSNNNTAEMGNAALDSEIVIGSHE